MAPRTEVRHDEAVVLGAETTFASLRYPPFLVLLALGLAARVALMVLYFPAVMLWFDSPRFARLGGMRMFGDFWMPAGYPFLLQTLRLISPELWVTIAFQHVLGLGTAVILFLAVCRLGLPRWLACLPAAVAFLSGDHLYLEHTVMADFFLLFLAAAGLGAAVFGLTDKMDLRLLATGSALLASAALARSVGIVLLPVLVVCVAFWAEKTRRLVAVSAALLPGFGVFILYVSLFFASKGEYLGLTDMRGWNLYSRVAPFADCAKLGPLPKKMARLCEQRLPSERPGPFGYVWDANSIARRKFPLNPTKGKLFSAFAWRVIRHQPRDYLTAVTVDLARYVAPSLGANRPFSGQPREIVSFGWRDLEVERIVVTAMSWGYRGTMVDLRAQKALGLYQQWLRLGGGSLACCFLFTLIGMLTARGKLRLGICLFGLSGLALYLLPTLTVSYDFRYGIPPATLMAVSGALGAAECCALVKRLAFAKAGGILT